MSPPVASWHACSAAHALPLELLAAAELEPAITLELPPPALVPADVPWDPPPLLEDDDVEAAVEDALADADEAPADVLDVTTTAELPDPPVEPALLEGPPVELLEDAPCWLDASTDEEPPPLDDDDDDDVLELSPSGLGPQPTTNNPATQTTLHPALRIVMVAPCLPVVAKPVCGLFVQRRSNPRARAAPPANTRPRTRDCGSALRSVTECTAWRAQPRNVLSDF